jgi:hypothetical protein
MVLCFSFSRFYVSPLDDYQQQSSGSGSHSATPTGFQASKPQHKKSNARVELGMHSK